MFKNKKKVYVKKFKNFRVKVSAKLCAKWCQIVCEKKFVLNKNPPSFSKLDTLCILNFSILINDSTNKDLADGPCDLANDHELSLCSNNFF